MVLLEYSGCAAYKAVAVDALAADKDKRFAPQAAASYLSHQTANITHAAVPYTREDEVKAAFGKANHHKFGVLPVLLVIQNDTGKALRLRSAKWNWYSERSRRPHEAGRRKALGRSAEQDYRMHADADSAPAPHQGPTGCAGD